MPVKTERICKGLLVKPDAKFFKSGGSIGLIIPLDVVSSIGITEGRGCRIFRNIENQLIIELTQDGEPKTE